MSYVLELQSATTSTEEDKAIWSTVSMGYICLISTLSFSLC